MARKFTYDERELMELEAIDLGAERSDAKRKVEAKRLKQKTRDKARRQVRLQAERHAERVANRRVQPDQIPAYVEG